ncbi:MAG: NAD(P)/FAD-dependent oxidoreductase [Phycisphaerales bacterium]|nr:NAD(P)/FAD-dependent oxidoreductase [Phycisphaerae bacterium]NNM25233.1 NAD(P)/FAD-dependent oxidoreductase [Phycisphaerales bacterium]
MVVGELTIESELVVIGGGPGGHAAACRASELGVDTTLVDDRPALGGSWLHEACVPSKQLVRLAATIRGARAAATSGVEFSTPRIDIERLRARTDETIARIAEDLTTRCRRQEVRHVVGTARFESGRQLAVAGSSVAPRLRFRRAIIAAGSRERWPDGLRRDHPRITGTAEALRRPSLCDRVLVMGGSASGLEVASIYAALGSTVTLVYAGDELIPHADADLTACVATHLRGQLASITPGVSIASVDDIAGVDDIDGGVRVSLDDGSPPQDFERVVIAIGRASNLDDLDLARTKVQLDEAGWITVDECLQTTDPRIFAIGDATGEPMLALKAAHQGHLAAERVAGWESTFDARAIPAVLFTEPPLAWCGLTERQLAEQSIPFAVQRSQWVAAGTAGNLPDGDGFTKIIYDPDTQLVLGVGIVGAGAGELIAESALALEMGAVLTDLAATVHPHPSASETIGALARGPTGTDGV